jgi:hypothetical protein
MLLLGSVVFVLLGVVLENASNISMQDFKVVYYPARCLIQHGDPYSESAVLRVYRAEEVSPQLDTPNMLQFASRYIYLPASFSFTVPFAMLPWGPAHILWMALTMGSLLLASFLIWSVGAEDAPVLSGVLIGFLLANSEVLVILCNSAGIAVSLCIVAVWCFLSERFVPVGILCLAVSLVIKPQDAGLVWLYFLLAGGVFRKRAGQTLLAAVALGLPGLLWVWRASPRWIEKWHANLSAFSAHGGLTDPGPASANGYGLSLMTHLQTVFAFFRDDPRFYNSASYLVCAPLLLVWAWVTLRSRPSSTRAWLALAAVTALSMLPVYHRLNDTKLLLLTVPACAILWAEGGAIRWLALAVNAAGFTLTGDIPWTVAMLFIRYLHLSTTGLSGQILRAALVFPTPLILLLMGIFYLWVYGGAYGARASASALSAESASPAKSPLAPASPDSGLKLNNALRLMASERA